MEGPKDDLKWFGEGFDGFPKRLPEDCVEYILMIINASLSPKEELNRLEAVRKEALKLKKKFLHDYIWQRDEFDLRPGVQSINGLKYLYGLTKYGDSVEDEWLVVFVLRELSRVFPDLWIKANDTDGEFLLIEAANALPRWLNPEIAASRVWINHSKLHIIPIAAAQASLAENKTLPVSRSLSLTEAYKIISTTPQFLIHSPLIEAEAFYRLRNYPSQISDSIHHALITIPRKLAYILYSCPASIAPAVEAFYLRDPIAMKQLQKDVSELVLPPADLVTTSIKFTKILYAQLKSQQFSPSGAWKIILLDAEKAAKSDHTKQPNFVRLEMGMKINSGFEMLVNEPVHQDNRSVQEVKILLEDLKEDASLPTNTEMRDWPNSSKEDNEGWLDINFEDFEKELHGSNNTGIKSAATNKVFEPQAPSGFGDAKTEADLRKMVQRFEEFLNDEDAGIDGAEVDEMDFDDDNDDDDDDDEVDGEGDSEDEDKAVNFDEKEFVRMMREMMGMPPGEPENEDLLPEMKMGTKSSSTRKSNKAKELNSNHDDDDDGDNDENEGEDIREVMRRIESELNEAGVLDLGPTPSRIAALKSGKGKELSAGKDSMEKQDWEDESDEEINIDFNLARNLLESLKSQGGLAGPGSNLMGMMGIQMPRDEDTS